ncbi:multidrug effflux MFS transporter [Acinetobacter sp. NIPH 2377]|uniref:multidrug effflux MFS transporter n=1 Tax=Acinetobacter terrestris TaxID=2529843 RepID=UPI00148FEF3D|nr:multidrug effflux MFS transporter [Acinetobacter terrestris]NNH36266.1 multidrug effflux MFS transporter [Acinetobacter terrestris]
MNQTSTNKSYTLGWVFLLTLLTAFSALSTDMYLPALPMMAAEYQVSTQMIANTLGAYFLGLACGQLIYGPLSDRYGRKPPLYFGLMIYIVASLCCAIAPNDTILLIFRVLQAFGGCAGVVIVRAAIRDRLNMKESAQVFSTMLLAMGLAPILAPAFGALLIQYFHWSSIFYLLTAIGVVTLVLVHFYFDETLPQSNLQNISARQISKNYLRLFKDQTFAIPMFAGAMLYGTLYCYISASSNLFINFLKVPEQQFAYLFGLNAFGLMLFAFINKRLIHYFSVSHLFILGALIQISGVFIISLNAWSYTINPYLICSGLFLLVGGIGFTGPNSMAIVMQNQVKQAGLASALMGGVQFFCGFIMTIFLSILPFNILQNMSIIMLITGLPSVYFAIYNHQGFVVLK